MAVAHLNGTDLFYVEVGEGVPCLVMHRGLGGDTPAPRENPYLSSGQLSGHPDGDKPYVEATARTIDDEVKRIVRGTHEEATRLLDTHRDELEALVRSLWSARPSTKRTSWR